MLVLDTGIRTVSTMQLGTYTYIMCTPGLCLGIDILGGFRPNPFCYPLEWMSHDKKCPGGKPPANLGKPAHKALLTANNVPWD